MDSTERNGVIAGALGLGTLIGTVADGLVISDDAKRVIELQRKDADRGILEVPPENESREYFSLIGRPGVKEDVNAYNGVVNNSDIFFGLGFLLLGGVVYWAGNKIGDFRASRRVKREERRNQMGWRAYGGHGQVRRV